MISIDELAIRLPAGFEARADSIVRLLAEELARIAPEADRTVHRLAMPPVEIPPGASDAQVAVRIAGAMTAEIGRLR